MGAIEQVDCAFLPGQRVAATLRYGIPLLILYVRTKVPFMVSKLREGDPGAESGWSLVGLQNLLITRIDVCVCARGMANFKFRNNVRLCANVNYAAQMIRVICKAFSVWKL